MTAPDMQRQHERQTESDGQMRPAHEGAKRFASDVVESVSGEDHEGDAIGQGEAEETVALAAQPGRHMAGEEIAVKDHHHHGGTAVNFDEHGLPCTVLLSEIALNPHPVVQAEPQGAGQSAGDEIEFEAALAMRGK